MSDDFSMPDDGFYHTRRSETVAEAVTETPRGRDVTVAKAVLQRYIQRWLTPDSQHAKLLRMYAPRSANFVLDRPADRSIHVETGFSWDSDDPAERKVQVARFHTRLRERYPAVLIVDGGFRVRAGGLGDLQAGRIVEGTVVDYDLVTSMVISMEVMVAALDESTASDLAVLLGSILGSPLRRFGGGNHLTSSDESNSYQVTLPLEVSFGSLSRDTITEDTEDSKWTTSTSLEVSYEAIGSIRTRLPIRRGDDDFGDVGGAMPSVGQVGNLGSDIEPSFDGPATVRVGTRYSYRLLDPDGNPIRRKGEWKVQVSDHRIATLKVNREFNLLPRRPGSIELRLVDTARQDLGTDTGQSTPKVIARLSITVTA